MDKRKTYTTIKQETVVENLLFLSRKAKNVVTLSTGFDNLDTDVATRAPQTEEHEEEMSARADLRPGDDAGHGIMHE
jgi:hypothetical protein